MSVCVAVFKCIHLRRFMPANGLPHIFSCSYTEKTLNFCCSADIFRKRGLKARVVVVSDKYLNFVGVLVCERGKEAVPVGAAWQFPVAFRWPRPFRLQRLGSCSCSAEPLPRLERIRPFASPPSRIPASRCFGHGFSVAGGLCFSQLAPPELCNSAVKRSPEGFFSVSCFFLS